MAVISMKQLLEAGVHLVTKLVAGIQNEEIYLHRKKRNLHH